jgi:hypothetical protein
MLNFNCLENFNFNLSCFLGKKKTKDEEEELDRKIYNVSREHKVSILPIIPDFDIDNLYPLTDHVELWNIFIVGNDKTYILVNINDDHIILPNPDLLNHQAKNILSDDLEKLFDGIWDKTLQGKQLQFYMVWNGKLYFINTYPFFNGKNKVIGAIMFMRTFESMPETRFTTLDGYLVPVRYSTEQLRQYQEQSDKKKQDAKEAKEEIQAQAGFKVEMMRNRNMKFTQMDERFAGLTRQCKSQQFK